MDLRTPGVFLFLDSLSGARTGALVKDVERLGYSAVWFPEVFGREPFSFASYLLAQTEQLIIATGIVVPYAYEPFAIANATRTLGELYGDRFLLGMGVSNAQGNEKRGIPYRKPISFMKDYLTRLESVPYTAPDPEAKPPIVLAGMMPNMLRLAATQTQGTHTYFTVVDQVAETRKVLGPEPWLCAALAVILETAPERARATAREYMRTYLGIEHYRERFLEVGFSAADFRSGGSDRLVDSVVAWGNEEAIRKRVFEYYAAGASHVCILPLQPGGGLTPHEEAITLLSPAA